MEDSEALLRDNIDPAKDQVISMKSYQAAGCKAAALSAAASTGHCEGEIKCVAACSTLLLQASAHGSWHSSMQQQAPRGAGRVALRAVLQPGDRSPSSGSARRPASAVVPRRLLQHSQPGAAQLR